MSTWTYVDGYIEFNVNGKHSDNLENLIKKVLGKIVTFDDLMNCEEECITSLPMGSEGSLEYELIKTQDSYLAVFSNSALRDFDNFNELNDWIYFVVKNEEVNYLVQNVFIRSTNTYGDKAFFYLERYTDKLKYIRLGD